MTMTLWIDTEKEETIELGATLACYKAFAEMGRVAGGAWQTDYEALAGVLSQCEDQEDADPDWLADVRKQAKQFLADHNGISEEAQAILGQLAGEEDFAERPPDQRQ